MSLFNWIADRVVPASALRYAKSGPSTEEALAVLDYYLDRMRVAVAALAEQTRTPPAYLVVPESKTSVEDLQTEPWTVPVRCGPRCPARQP